MSRIGKHAVVVPSGVQVTIAGQDVSVKGKNGSLNIRLIDDVLVSLEDGLGIVVKPASDSKRSRAMWGMSRTLVNNLVKGVTDGFTKELELVGVGYRAAVQGSELVLQLGFSHEIRYPIPSGVKVTCEKPTSIVIWGANAEEVGQMAANVRSYRPPEPYKGKGVKYVGEYINRKEGKKK